MFLTETKANMFKSTIYSNLYTIPSQTSIFLPSIIPFLSLSPLPNHKSFTSSLHLLCGLPLLSLPSSFARYTLLINLSSPILSKCPNHFNTFFSILSITLNSHPNLSLSIGFLTLSLSLCYICFSNTSSQILLLFSSPVHLMTTSSNHKLQLVSQLIHITPVLFLDIILSFHYFAIVPQTFLPSCTL